jgi:hypothetical protein
MRLGAVLLKATTLELILVRSPFGAKEPPFGHSFPDSLSFAVTRHPGHGLTVGCVFAEFRRGVHP